MSAIRYAHLVTVTKTHPAPTGTLVNDIVVYSQYNPGHNLAPGDCEAIVSSQIQSLLSVPVELEAKRVTQFTVVYKSGG